MRIELVIDELVLHGFDARQRHAIGDAVSSELTRLVQVHGRDLLGHRSIEVAGLDAGSFAATGATPSRAGAGIANSVFAAVRGAKS